MSALLDKRLVVVTGKGGTGKTTVAAALGLAAARRGKRTVVVEVAEQERLCAIFRKPSATGHELELAPGLFGLSVEPRRAMEEWLAHQLHSSTLAGLLGGSRIFQLLTAAAPGITELVTMGKIWDVAQLERRTGGSVFDLAIVDAPSTGHGLALLNAPSTYARIAGVGPIARQAARIDGFTRDRGFTAVLATALPEEMPVTEAIELDERLGSDGFELAAVVVNGLYPERFSAEEADALDGRLGDPAAVDAAKVALDDWHRALAQREQVERLAAEVRAPIVRLPFLFEPDLGRAEVEELASELEEHLP